MLLRTGTATPTCTLPHAPLLVRMEPGGVRPEASGQSHPLASIGPWVTHPLGAEDSEGTQVWLGATPSTPKWHKLGADSVPHRPLGVICSSGTAEAARPPRARPRAAPVRTVRT